MASPYIRIGTEALAQAAQGVPAMLASPKVMLSTVGGLFEKPAKSWTDANAVLAEDVGSSATGANYDPDAFSALRRRQILAHHRNGNMSERVTITIWAVTWNVAGSTPPLAAVRDALGQPAAGASLPEIVVFGVQEAVDLNAREVILSDNSASDQWRVMLEAALTAWSRPEQQPAQPSASPANDGDADGARPADPAPSAEPPCGYVLVSCVQLVGIVLMVWARRELAPHVADVRAISIGTGALGFLGNKGAAAIRLSLYHSSIAVVCAHLNASKGAADARNAESRLLEQRLMFAVPREAAATLGACESAVDSTPNDAQSVTVRLVHHDIVVWLGDLNYRLNLGDGGFKRDDVRRLVADGQLEPLLALDQLGEAQRSGKAFVGYTEAPIAFAPTYKYDKRSDQYDTGEKQRVPAWTDRILWAEHAQPLGGGAAAMPRVSALAYTRRETDASDHRPVHCLLHCQIEIESAEKKARLHKALDQWEESRIPAIALAPRELAFAPESDAGQSLSLALQNVGQTVAHFSFRAKPDCTSPFPSWLTVSPASGEVRPGQTVTLTLHATRKRPLPPLPPPPPPEQVGSAGASGAPPPQATANGFAALLDDDDEPPALGSPAPSALGAADEAPPPPAGGDEREHLTDVLILTVVNGRDAFLPVSVDF